MSVEKHQYSLPVKTGLEAAMEIIGEELDANNWDVEIPSPTLEWVPYFFFNYDSYVESSEEGGKIRSVEESTNGTSSLNGVANTLDDVMSEMFHLELLEEKMPTFKGVKSIIKSPRFEESDAKVVAQIKIAAQEKVPRANVHISGMKLAFVPFWQFEIELDDETKVKLRLNGISGEFEQEETNIPYQGKTTGELFRETVSDLRSPEEWIEYVKGIITELIDIFHPEKNHPYRGVAVIILLIIALILIGIGFVNL